MLSNLILRIHTLLCGPIMVRVTADALAQLGIKTNGHASGTVPIDSLISALASRIVELQDAAKAITTPKDA